LDQEITLAEPITITKEIALNTKANEHVRHWLESLSTDHPSALWDPAVGVRRQAIWDDHGEAFAVTRDDLGLRCRVVLPVGLYRISLYFFPYRGHSHALAREFRDMVLTLGVAPKDGKGPSNPLFRTRVANFDSGVYKQFVVPGDAEYTFHLDRNFSYNTMVNGIFVDKIQGPPDYRDDMPRAFMGNRSYEAPKLPSLTGAAPDLKTTAALWKSVQGEPVAAGTGIQGPRGPAILTLRLAAANNAPVGLLDRWRWSVPLWTPADHESWKQAMTLAWQGHLKMNSPIAAKAAPQTKGKTP
jgi:hypothetical protein